MVMIAKKHVDEGIIRSAMGHGQQPTMEHNRYCQRDKQQAQACIGLNLHILGRAKNHYYNPVLALGDTQRLAGRINAMLSGYKRLDQRPIPRDHRRVGAVSGLQLAAQRFDMKLDGHFLQIQIAFLPHIRRRTLRTLSFTSVVLKTTRAHVHIIRSQAGKHEGTKRSAPGGVKQAIAVTKEVDLLDNLVPKFPLGGV